MKREIAGLEAAAGDRAAKPLRTSCMRRLDEARAASSGGSAKKYCPRASGSCSALEREVAALRSGAGEGAARAHAPTPRGRKQPDNPAYIQLQTQLSATVNEQSGHAARRSHRLRAQMADYQRKIAMAPQTEKEYRELARDYTNAQAKYQEMRAKQMEAQLAQNLGADRKGERFTLIEPPLPPEEPVSPNRAIIWVARRAC